MHLRVDTFGRRYLVFVITGAGFASIMSFYFPILPKDTQPLDMVFFQGLATFLAIVIGFMTFFKERLSSDVTHSEDKALNHVLYISGYSYAQWDEEFEHDIQERKITNRYAEKLMAQGRETHEARDEAIRQQKRLENLKVNHTEELKQNKEISSFVGEVEVYIFVPLLFSIAQMMTPSNLIGNPTSSILIYFIEWLTLVGITLIFVTSLGFVTPKMFGKSNTSGKK